MNHLTLVGRLGADPELRYTKEQTAVTNLRLAVDRPGKDEPDWMDVTVWGKTAQAACEYLRKGAKVTVAGRVEPDVIELDGKRYNTVRIHAQQVEFGSAARNDSDTAAREQDREAAATR